MGRVIGNGNGRLPYQSWDRMGRDVTLVVTFLAAASGSAFDVRSVRVLERAETAITSLVEKQANDTQRITTNKEAVFGLHSDLRHHRDTVGHATLVELVARMDERLKAMERERARRGVSE